MKKLITNLILSMLLFSACQKEHNETCSVLQPATQPPAAKAAVATVSLTGKVTPADAVSDIYLLGYNPATSIHAVIDPVNGIFKALGLTGGGIYALHFVPSPSYRGVIDTLVKLTPGQSLDLGAIRFVST